MIQVIATFFKLKELHIPLFFRVDIDVSLRTMKGILACLKMVKRKRKKKRCVMAFVTVV